MWGFDLDMSAVRLMRRETDNWQEVAAEKIEGADIEERLMALVERVDDGAPVELFLPRDQILYTDVAITAEENARDEIEAALKGATPYAVEDLDLDWEMIAPDTARVAAIALETLDEAVAFAEVRGLKIGGFSSLADPKDFPRQPDFSGHNILTFEDNQAEIPAAPVTFASARVTSKPRPDAGSLAPVAPEAEPVVKVDDEAPIMRIKAPTSVPLDPGRPISAPVAPPRVRTDIAAAVVSEQVASLTPPSVKVRRGAPAFWRVGAVFAVAFLVTVGIATLVWQLVPLGPGSTDIPLTENGGNDAGATIEPVPEPQVASPAPTPETPAPAEPEIEVAAPEAEAEIPDEAPSEPEIAEAPPGPDLPQPVVASEAGVIGAPAAEDASPVLIGLDPVTRNQRPTFKTALRSGEGLPFIDLGLPAEPTPRALAAIQLTAPVSGPEPRQWEGDLPGAVQLASVDPLAPEAGPRALPDAATMTAAALPALGTAPEAFVAPPVQDTVEGPKPEVVARVEPTAPLAAPVPDVAEPQVIEREVADPDEANPQATDPEVAEPQVPDAAPDTDNALPALTAFAQALPETAPRARPGGFTSELERRRYGGRTRTELAEVRPRSRPASAQAEAIAARNAASDATALAIGASPKPRGRPDDFDAIVAVAIVQKQAERVTASLDFQTPNTSAAIEAALEEDAEPEPAPSTQVSIPSSASVSRQATISDAIRLNRVNLVGVYGSASDRRALIRLPSGRFVKVKVGDRVDGGTVAKITDDELIYRKGRRTVLLSVPKG